MNLSCDLRIESVRATRRPNRLNSRIVEFTICEPICIALNPLFRLKFFCKSPGDGKFSVLFEFTAVWPRLLGGYHWPLAGNAAFDSLPAGEMDTLLLPGRKKPTTVLV